MTRGFLASLAQARAEDQLAAEEAARANATPCTQEQNLLAVAIILDRLYDTASPVDELERIDKLADDEPLACQECERDVRRAYRYGAFLLCRACATRRLVIAARLDELEPPPLEDAKPEAPPQTATERAAA